MLQGKALRVSSVLQCLGYGLAAAVGLAEVRIDYMMERVQPGKADVWTGEVGEQGCAPPAPLLGVPVRPVGAPRLASDGGDG